MTSKVEPMPNVIRWQNQTGADPPTEAMEVDTSQRTQVGIITVVKSVEEGDMTIVSLVVALDM